MKRKYLVTVLLVALAMTLVVPGALAATTDQTDLSGWFSRMFDFHRQWVSNQVSGGQLTTEQGQAWNQHFDQMQQFHSQNGFGGMMGSGYGGMMGGSGYGGMMGGFR